MQSNTIENSNIQVVAVADKEIAREINQISYILRNPSNPIVKIFIDIWGIEQLVQRRNYLLNI